MQALFGVSGYFLGGRATAPAMLGRGLVTPADLQAFKGLSHDD